MYLVVNIVGGICEAIFSTIRRHEINEGFLVTGMLIPLTLPPSLPLWQAAIGTAFGVVIGKEIFGGVGKNFLNPALVARAFLESWTARDFRNLSSRSLGVFCTVTHCQSCGRI
jgi:Na+-transporting NADH:ubiquinone oxidoreductase subunit B